MISPRQNVGSPVSGGAPGVIDDAVELMPTLKDDGAWKLKCAVVLDESKRVVVKQHL